MDEHFARLENRFAHFAFYTSVALEIKFHLRYSEALLTRDLSIKGLKFSPAFFHKAIFGRIVFKLTLIFETDSKTVFHILIFDNFKDVSQK